MNDKAGPVAAESFAAQGGRRHRADGSVVAALQPSTTFARDDDYQLKAGHLYSRYGGPTDGELEALICYLEGAKGALAFASGMAAIACVIEALPPGARVLAPTTMYFAALHWMRRAAAHGRIVLTEYDNEDETALYRAIATRGADLVWVETPANPTWAVTDIAAAAVAAKAAGALVCVDGTCAPPCTTKALALGADIVMHSATKYLNGHSDVTAGVLAFADPEARARHELVRRHMGAHLGAFEAWLLMRGLRTLWVRFARQSETAFRLAEALQQRPEVAGVRYPGLSTHPHHAIAARQMSGGFGAMLSFTVKGGFEAAKRVATGTRLFLPATSLGSVESLIEHRRAVEGPDSPTDPALIRLSVGLEAFDDLWGDLDAALRRP